ncbi:MAG: glycerate kinase [Clostridia bacterium]|nr:glycerate kinase [Clostridia bacterium]
MKLIFAPDSFKGSLTSINAAARMAEGARRVFPDAQCMLLPMADGGEGTLDALILPAGGAMTEMKVTGPHEKEVSAKLGLLPDGTAVVEMAQASGLPLMRGKRDPMIATSFGTGQLIRAAAHDGIRILVGIGGSATNDGGMGLLSALGAKFYDENDNLLRGCGADLIRVRRADLNGIDTQVLACPMDVLCDVDNPLLGESGATYVYGRQKGADDKMLAELEKGMENYARVLENALGRDISSFPGAGAAGGVGAALCGVLGARRLPGAQTVLDLMGFDEKLQGAAVCFTGEGRMDGQSLKYGKAPVQVAERCKKANVPCIAIVGGIGEGGQAFCEKGRSVLSIANGPKSLDECLLHAGDLMADAAERAMRLVQMKI